MTIGHSVAMGTRSPRHPVARHWVARHSVARHSVAASLTVLFSYCWVYKLLDLNIYSISNYQVNYKRHFAYRNHIWWSSLPICKCLMVFCWKLKLLTRYCFVTQLAVCFYFSQNMFKLFWQHLRIRTDPSKAQYFTIRGPYFTIVPCQS